MHSTINARNVCEALVQGAKLLMERGVDEDSRAGRVRVVPWPVMTITRFPQERVLFNDLRDANPFFHMYEAVWMLAGRNDAAPLNRFVKDFGTAYGEEDGSVHGAYGHRWRTAFGFDQLDVVVQKLRQDRGSRQCVLQMWDTSQPARCRSGECDPEQLAGNDDLRGNWRDRPCNTHIYLRVRRTKELDIENMMGILEQLDMTVCCRSNDAIWGCHGANAVHFSVLQEYLAARIGIHVGRLYQLSNNYHIYHAQLEDLHRRAAKRFDSLPFDPEMLADDRYSVTSSAASVHADSEIRSRRMFDNPDSIDDDIIRFIDWDSSSSLTEHIPQYINQFFKESLHPAMVSHRLHKLKLGSKAFEFAGTIASSDWRLACCEWLARRSK